MPLKLRQSLSSAVIAGWKTTAREAFIQSEAQRRLKAEIENYLLENVAGRSFLLAGHRGSGKTTLVKAVIDDIRREKFTQAEATIKQRSSDSLPPRVPLLVKLHGPTLIKGDVSAATTLSSRPEAPGPTMAMDVHVYEEAARPSPEPAKGKAADSQGQIQKALSLIAIALYRAVADEFGEAIAFATQQHAKELIRRGRPTADIEELAASLKLELDSATDAGTLRDYWARMRLPLDVEPLDWLGMGTLDLAAVSSPNPVTIREGRLGSGLLWHADLSKDWTDRGFQEIVALATAAQAFQVCIGSVTASKKESETDAREDEISLKSSAGLRDVVNKVFALAVGLGVGCGLKDQGPAAALAGVAAALTTSFTVGWSAKRSHKGERSSEYTFLPDRTVQSLDRDLPLVIDRIRAIGLTPIFVVDEIDKIDAPDKPIGDIIDRLKQLTADYGFFCFLTDRDYLDLIEEKLKKEVYPREQTYFSNREPISYTPADVANYLRSAIVVSTASTSSDANLTEHLAALIASRVIMHRSEFNTRNLVRELGNFDLSNEARIRSLESYRLETILQLAIEYALRQPAIRARIETDRLLAQIAIEVFYMISRVWREQNEFVMITEDVVKTYVAHRMRRGEADVLSLADLKVFTAALRSMADLLCDFTKLYNAIDTEKELDEKDKPLLALFESSTVPFLSSQGGQKYQFRWDAYGMLIELKYSDDVDRAVEVVNLVDDLLKDNDLSFDDLVTAGVLPLTITDAAIRTTLFRLDDSSSEYPERPTDLDRLAVVRDAIFKAEMTIKIVLVLVVQVRRLTRCSGTVAMAAISRYIDVPRLVEKRSSAELWKAFQDDIDDLDMSELSKLTTGELSTTSGIESWRQNFVVAKASGFQVQQSDSWPSCLKRVQEYLSRKQRTPPAVFQDVVSAVAGQLPGRLFRRDLGNMTIADWSELALEGASFKKEVPAWTIVAGLSALGFGKSVLTLVAGALHAMKDLTPNQLSESSQLAKDLTASAPDAEERLLLIVSDAEPSIDVRKPGGAPVLIVRSSQISTYYEALDWMQKLGVFTGRADDGLGDDNEGSSQVTS